MWNIGWIKKEWVEEDFNKVEAVVCFAASEENDDEDNETE